MQPGQDTAGREKWNSLMTTIDALRARLRTRLEEATAAVWTDAELDECLTGALETYSYRYPAEVASSLTAGGGDASVALPTGAVSVRRVTLASGEVVPRRGAPSGSTAGEELAWEVFGGLLRFSRPLAAQDIAVWHTTTQTFASLPAADEGLVVIVATGAALDARAIQDAKRGIPTDHNLLNHAREAADRAFGQRGRRLRAVVAG